MPENKFNFRSKKSVSRLLAVQMIYMMENNKDCYLNNFDVLMQDAASFHRAKYNKPFLRSLMDLIFKHGNEMNALIDQAVRNESSRSKINFISYIIMAVAMVEIIYFPQTASYVIISEFIALANLFVTELDVKFINAILDFLIKNHCDKVVSTVL